MTARRRRQGREFQSQAEEMPRLEDIHERVRALEAVPPPPPLKIKLTGDSELDDVVAVDDRAFTIDVDTKMDGHRLTIVRVAVGTVSSSGSVTVMIHNETQGVDMLTVASGVGAGAFQADVSANIVAPPDCIVATDDVLVISIVAAGTDARGLGVTLDFT